MRIEEEHRKELERRGRRVDGVRTGARCRWFLTHAAMLHLSDSCAVALLSPQHTLSMSSAAKSASAPNRH
jgi:hypothetical protein